VNDDSFGRNSYLSALFKLFSSEVAYKLLSLPDWTGNTGVVNRDRYQNDLMKIDRIPIHHKG
jgi:hypothetical protein